MYCIKNILIIVSGLTIIKYTNCFEKAFTDNVILRTEAVIRNTTNKLFATLKLKKNNSRLSRYLIINKHFTSITLQDHDTLSKIVQISRSNNEGNNSSVIFMTAINELLNDDNREIEENEINNNGVTEKYNEHVVNIIKTFLRNLKETKDLHAINTFMEINENMLKLIKEASYANTTVGRQYFENETDSDEFWKPSGRRIFKGERTKIKHFPFMASIQIFNAFQCGGSIIKSDLVITASSCLQLAWNNRFYRENPAFLSVRVGSSFYSGGGEVIPVLEVYFHPNYNPKNLRNNICIVRLIRKIKFRWRARRRVRKIDIDRHDFSLPFNTPGITIVGWGAKGQSNVVRDPWQNTLSYAVLNVYALKDCQDIYSKEYVTHKNFCAGFMSKGGGACNRDIGGPGIDNGKLMGVVSFGSPVCGAADAPTVFTKLGYYADWIDNIMEQEVPYSKKKTTLLTSKIPYPIILKHGPTSTTFKVPPLAEEESNPTAINEDENTMRMFDENLFNEFLKTMFDSKDIAEYQDIFKDAKQSVDSEISNIENQSNGYVSREVTSPYVEFDVDTVTKSIDFEAESEETATHFDYSNKYEFLDDKIKSQSEDENNVAKTIDDTNLKSIIEDTVPVNTQKELKGTTQSDFKEVEMSPIDNKNNESVLTLLYLSAENKDRGFEQSGENQAGLSIPTDSFRDLTRSKSKNKNLYDVLPDTELYEILSEVIDDEMQKMNKTM